MQILPTIFMHLNQSRQARGLAEFNVGCWSVELYFTPQEHSSAKLSKWIDHIKQQKKAQVARFQYTKFNDSAFLIDEKVRTHTYNMYK